MHIDRTAHDETRIRLDAWNRKFEGLQRRISRLAAEGRRGLEKQLLEVRERKSEQERRLREAAHGTRSSWDDVRTELEETVRDFRSLARQVRERARRTG